MISANSGTARNGSSAPSSTIRSANSCRSDSESFGNTTSLICRNSSACLAWLSVPLSECSAQITIDEALSGTATRWPATIIISLWDQSD